MRSAEDKIRALAELGRTMVSGPDYERVLADVIATTARILDCASGAFMIFDASSGRLCLQRPAFGVEDESIIHQYQVGLAEGGNAVSVFVTGRPYFSNDVPNDPLVIHRYAELFDTRNLLTAALQIEGRSIGVVHCINKRGDFTEDDQELLQLIAPQLAVIIRSATMLRQLRQRERELERVIAIHQALGERVLLGGDLESLVEGLSQLLDLAVVATEGPGQITAPASMSRALRRSALRTLTGVWTRLERATTLDLTPIRTPLEAQHDLALLSVPIVVEGELLGQVAAIGAPRQLDDVSGRALQQAAIVFALDVSKRREVYEVERRLKADAAEHLWVAESDAEAVSLLRRLGLDERVPHRVAALRLVSGDRQLLLSPRAQTYLNGLHRSAAAELSGGVRSAVALSRGQAVIVVLAHRNGQPLQEQAETLQARFDRLLAYQPPPPGTAPLLGVGGVAARPLELRRSLDEANTVLEVQARLGGGRRVLLFEQLGLYRLLTRPAGADDLRDYVERTLGPLLEHDRRTGADWVRLLAALVDHNFSVTAAARQLGLHLNTAKYRAARIASLLNADFGDAEARLDLHLALKIRRLGDLAQPSSAWSERT